MSTQPDPNVVAWLGVLESSALIRQEMSSVDTYRNLAIIERIISHQITILKHYALGCSRGLGSKSDELRQVIELYNTFAKPYKHAPAIMRAKLSGLSAIMTAEFKKLNAEEVDRDLNFYILLRNDMMDKCRASKHLDAAIEKGLMLMEIEMAAINDVRSCLYNKRKVSG